MKIELNIAVRTLVEFVYRGGDLSFEFSGTARSLAGIRGHQKVQRSRPETYAAEVPASFRLETERFVLNISGRIDGLYQSEDGTVIDEIKTTTRNLEAIESDRYPAHWAQAKVYAHIYAAEKGLESVGVQLTYYQIDTGRTREFRRAFDAEILAEFFRSLVDRYLRWAQTVARWIEVRNASIRNTAFPFADYRPGQRKMAVAVYRAICDGVQLIAQAATGIGKTMAAVFPAFKAMAKGHTETIFYLTARTTGRRAAEQALDVLRAEGLRLKSVTLTAKEKICFTSEGICSPDACEFAKGHFDRLGGALQQGFASDALTRERIEAIARKHRVCPFELSLELSLWADCIICDYNYALDPRVYLRRFFLDAAGNYTFLVDEAHNLVDRAREMFSAQVEKQPFLDLRRAVKNQLPEIYRHMGKINAFMVKARKTCAAAGGQQTENGLPQDLLPLFKGFMAATDRWLALNTPAPFRNDLMALYFEVSAFMRVSEQVDRSYAVLSRTDGRNYRLKLFCMDPSGPMRAALRRCRSGVFFSATLTPVDYFHRILGCSDDARHMAIGSPFPRENLGVFIAAKVSTLYRYREQTASEVADALGSLTEHRSGNYLFFFPSYSYMQLVHTHFIARAGSATVIVQTPAMSEAQREAFIAQFASDRPDTLVGFAVMGGIFGEGIDLAGNRLTGAAIIGVGLPGISQERELIRAYFTAVDGAGFEFAYLYPGINRVLQAVGRVIRSRRDRGTVLLIDRRYATRRYASLFPVEWRPVRVDGPRSIASGLHRFWSG